MPNAVRSSRSIRLATVTVTVEEELDSTLLGNGRARAHAGHASRVRHKALPQRYRGNALTDQPHPSTGDPEYTDQDTAYLRAVDAYCTRVNRRFLLACEYKSVLESLGYVVVPHGYKIVADDGGGTAAAA